MDEIDLLSQSLSQSTGEEWPEFLGLGNSDIAKSVFMPHTIPITLAEKMLSRGGGGQRKVVTHTQPPPVANNARQVQGQLGGLLKTVKAVEEKADNAAQTLAVVQQARSGSQDAERFQQAVLTSLLSAAPLLESRNWVGAAAHILPIIHGHKGAGAAFSTKPVSTFAWPVATAGVYALRKPRQPVVVVGILNRGTLRITMFAPDGGDVYYATRANPGDVTKNSTKYSAPVDVAINDANNVFPIRARAYVLFRGSDQVECANPLTVVAAAAPTVGGAGQNGSGNGSARRSTSRARGRGRRTSVAGRTTIPLGEFVPGGGEETPE
jgi:hypothetical protein